VVLEHIDCLDEHREERHQVFDQASPLQSWFIVLGAMNQDKIAKSNSLGIKFQVLLACIPNQEEQ